MNFLELSAKRYSCKRYDPAKKPERQQLLNILEAGRLAPTAKNLQEQHVYVIESEDGLAMIDRHTRSRYGAPVCLVVAFDKDNTYTYPGGKRDSGIEDATIVATHMMLAAAAEGVDSCWVNSFDPDALAADMNLPANESILMILDLGFASADSAPLPNHFTRRPLSDTVSWL